MTGCLRMEWPSSHYKNMKNATGDHFHHSTPMHPLHHLLKANTWIIKAWLFSLIPQVIHMHNRNSKHSLASMQHIIGHIIIFEPWPHSYKLNYMSSPTKLTSLVTIYLPKHKPHTWDAIIAFITHTWHFFVEPDIIAGRIGRISLVGSESADADPILSKKLDTPPRLTKYVLVKVKLILKSILLIGLWLRSGKNQLKWRKSLNSVDFSNFGVMQRGQKQICWSWHLLEGVIEEEGIVGKWEVGGRLYQSLELFQALSRGKTSSSSSHASGVFKESQGGRWEAFSTPMKNSHNYTIMYLINS